MRRLKRTLRDVPRYEIGTVEIFGHRTTYVDADTFLVMFQDAFVDKASDFLASKVDPLILDCGANIGLTVFRFKQLYPKSRIIAFEPDPVICACLRENVRRWKFSDVEVVQAAIWTHNQGVTFVQEGSTAGRVAGKGDVCVPTARLFDYLSESVDFIKLDIEGAECDVIPDCRERLCNVGSMVIEWHFRAGEPQTLGRALDVLAHGGHHYFVHHCWPVQVSRSWVFTPGDMEQILAIHTRKGPGLVL